jgi:plasmid stabilization system protein ParE
MAFDVIWLESAQNDIHDILTYIAADNPRAAALYIQGLRAAGDSLAEFPNIGRSFDARYRVTVYRNHLLFYLVDRSAKTVEIARVIDARRDVNAVID